MSKPKPSLPPLPPTPGAAKPPVPAVAATPKPAVAATPAAPKPAVAAAPATKPAPAATPTPATAAKAPAVATVPAVKPTATAPVPAPAATKPPLTAAKSIPNTAAAAAAAKPAPATAPTPTPPAVTAPPTLAPTPAPTPAADPNASLRALITTALSSSDVTFCERTLQQATAAGLESDSLASLRRKIDEMVWRNRVEALFGSRQSIAASNGGGASLSASLSPTVDPATQTALTDALREAEGLGIPKTDVYVIEASAQYARGEARLAIQALCGVPGSSLMHQSSAAARQVLALASAPATGLPVAELAPVQRRLQQLVSREKLIKLTASASTAAADVKAAMAEAKDAGLPSADEAFVAAAAFVRKAEVLAQVTAAVQASAAGSRPAVNVLRDLLTAGERAGLSESQLNPIVTILNASDYGTALEAAIASKQIDNLSKVIADINGSGGAVPNGVNPQRLADATTLLTSLNYVYEARQRTDLSILSGALQLAEHMGLEEPALALKHRIEYIITHQKLSELMDQPNLDALTAVFAHIETLPEWEDVPLLTRAHSMVETLKSAQDQAEQSKRELEAGERARKQMEEEAEKQRELEIEEEEKERILRITADEEDRRKQEAEELEAQRKVDDEERKKKAALDAVQKRKAEEEAKRKGIKPPAASAASAPVKPAVYQKPDSELTPRELSWRRIGEMRRALADDLAHVKYRFHYMTNERWNPVLASHSQINDLQTERLGDSVLHDPAAFAAAVAAAQAAAVAAAAVAAAATPNVDHKSGAAAMASAAAASSAAAAANLASSSGGFVAAGTGAVEPSYDPSTSSLSAVNSILARQLNIRYFPLHYIPRHFIPVQRRRPDAPTAGTKLLASASSSSPSSSAAENAANAGPWIGGGSHAAPLIGVFGGGDRSAPAGTGGGTSGLVGTSSLLMSSMSNGAITSRPKHSKSRSSLVVSGASPTGLMIVGGPNVATPPPVTQSILASGGGGSPAGPPASPSAAHAAQLQSAAALAASGVMKKRGSLVAMPALGSVKEDDAGAAPVAVATSKADDAPASEQDITAFPEGRSAYRGRVSKNVLSEPFMFAGLVHYTKDMGDNFKSRFAVLYRSHFDLYRTPTHKKPIKSMPIIASTVMKPLESRPGTNRACFELVSTHARWRFYGEHEWENFVWHAALFNRILSAAYIDNCENSALAILANSNAAAAAAAAAANGAIPPPPPPPPDEKSATPPAPAPGSSTGSGSGVAGLAAAAKRMVVTEYADERLLSFLDNLDIATYEREKRVPPPSPLQLNGPRALGPLTVSLIATLLREPVGQHLNALEVRYAGLDTHAMRELFSGIAANPRKCTLSVIDLTGNDWCVGPIVAMRSFGRMLTSIGASNVTSLVLDDCNIDDRHLAIWLEGFHAPGAGRKDSLDETPTEPSAAELAAVAEDHARAAAALEAAANAGDPTAAPPPPPDDGIPPPPSALSSKDPGERALAMAYSFHASKRKSVMMTCALRHLSIKQNRISDAGISVLCSILAHVPKLKVRTAQSTAAALGRSVAIAHDSTGLGGGARTPFARDTKSYVTERCLVHLELDCNKIGDAGSQVIANKLMDFCVQLNLRKNELTNLGAHSLAKALQHNHTLTAFDVSENSRVGIGGFAALCHAAQINSHLTGLTFPYPRDPKINPNAPAAPAASATPTPPAGPPPSADAKAGPRMSQLVPPPPKPKAPPTKEEKAKADAAAAAAAAASASPAPVPYLDKTGLSIMSCMFMSTLKPMSQTVFAQP